MITLKLQGRLGNQFFQYAFARAIQEKYYKNEKLFININAYKNADAGSGWENSLKYFNIPNLNYTNKLNINIVQTIVLYSYLVFRKISRDILHMGLDTKDFELHFVPFLNKLGIYCLNTGFYDFKKSYWKNKIILGCFESDKYFKNIESSIKKEYTSKYDVLEQNKKFYNNILNTNSVCLTVRRGDFTLDKNKKAFLICDEKYFKRSIDLISQKIKNPTFFVFSDDIEWAKKNLQVPQPCFYENSNNPIWEKVRLMSSCRHFILSNSTFSWWVQYLSPNEDKVVIAPSRWNNVIKHNDIYQDNWILVPIEEGEEYENISNRL